MTHTRRANTLGRAGVGLRRDNVFGVENFRPIALYDISIENLEERRDKALKFPTLKHAADFLGLLRHQHIARNIGKRLQSRKDGKIYAVRDQKVK